jgi:EpsI family protein
MKSSSSPSPMGRVLVSGVVVVVLAGVTLLAATKMSPEIGTSETDVNMDLPETIAGFTGEEQAVSEEEKKILPGDTEFARKLYTGPDGTSVNCQIVLAGAEKRSIHRPEICLPGQGWTIKSGVVTPVKLDDGRTLQAMKLTIARPVVLSNGDRRELSSLFYYWFVGKQTTTPHHYVRILKTSIDLLIHNTNHRWAYVVVSAPVLEGFAPNGLSESETDTLLQKFIAEVAPQIMGGPESMVRDL